VWWRWCSGLSGWHRRTVICIIYAIRVRRGTGPSTVQYDTMRCDAIDDNNLHRACTTTVHLSTAFIVPTISLHDICQNLSYTPPENPHVTVISNHLALCPGINQGCGLSLPTSIQSSQQRQAAARARSSSKPPCRHVTIRPQHQIPPNCQLLVPPSVL